MIEKREFYPFVEALEREFPRAKARYLEIWQRLIREEKLDFSEPGMSNLLLLISRAFFASKHKFLCYHAQEDVVWDEWGEFSKIFRQQLFVKVKTARLRGKGKSLLENAPLIIDECFDEIYFGAKSDWGKDLFKVLLYCRQSQLISCFALFIDMERFF